ncbi:phosphodiester glycosidase family protein [Pontibacter ruber]|uniref:Phosphodiester glycosidase family protein n=1 Tax=Pontibacter ruber TaxID=1343895 RepID=A0ABW5D018_9BACT|nr:phosphodiester glycosidase family protein [Pontibacter ruber]
MKRLLLLPLFVCLLQTVSLEIHAQAPEATAIQDKLHRSNWKKEKIGRGMHWRYYHGNGLYNSRQSINVLDINLNKAAIEVSLAHSDSALIKTSMFARNNGALAAVNGSYFDTKKGGSVVFLKTDGEVKANTIQTMPEYRENAAIAINADGKPAVIRKPAAGWQKTDAQEALASGPLLVYEGKPETMVPQAFNTNRHPRTAIGFTKDNHMLLVTVDGRSSEAYGMSNEELAQLMHSLGCQSAINLDGGGSTTMWIQGKGTNGVVNYPSDNKAYDHEGERAVANCILIRKVSRRSL